MDVCGLDWVRPVFQNSRPREGRGTIDGIPFRNSFMAFGDGRHKLPVRADVCESIAKRAGETVTVCLEERLDR
jgi:Domain of unknown function (DUF1905)